MVFTEWLAYLRLLLITYDCNVVLSVARPRAYFLMGNVGKLNEGPLMLLAISLGDNTPTLERSGDHINCSPDLHAPEAYALSGKVF